MGALQIAEFDLVTHNNGSIAGSDRQVAVQQLTLYADPGTDVTCGARWVVNMLEGTSGKS